MKEVREKVEPSSARLSRRLSPFARRLLEEWKRLRLPLSDGSIVVAVSGGADSVSLLLALEELTGARRLKIGVITAHLDHGLRALAGRDDALWVEELSKKLGFEVSVGHVDVNLRAAAMGDNLEQSARSARYEFLTEVALKHEAPYVLTAHTMDDQAETVLLRILRGSGAEGLGGIKPLRQLSQAHEIRLARPLLSWARRAGTQEYCAQRGVEPRVDAMNDDERYARVRVRKRLLPLLASFNGRAVEALVRTAQLLREDNQALELAAAELLRAAEAEGSTSDDSPRKFPPLRLDVLLNAPQALRRRALRLWIGQGRGHLRRLEMTHLLAVESLLLGERGGRLIELPGGAAVSRKRGRLYFHIKRVEKGGGAV